jgi:hypothetical protein
MNQPRRPTPAGPAHEGSPADARGLGWGIASLVAGVLAPVLGILSLTAYFLAAAGPLMHRASPRGPAGFLLGALLLAVLAGLLAAASAVSGIVALRASRRLNTGRIAGIVGLACTAFGVLAGLWMWAALAGPWFSA